MKPRYRWFPVVGWAGLLMGCETQVRASISTEGRMREGCQLRLSMAATNADSIRTLEWTPHDGYIGNPKCAYWLAGKPKPEQPPTGNPP